MKIRLETTHSEPKYSHAVEITVQQDDLNIHDLWQDVIVPALLGFGFQQETIDQINQP
jgi:NAD(P)H-hydrate repair Nnr-like enzyme with NAD(P)H-hydrate epimerase domain